MSRAMNRIGLDFDTCALGHRLPLLSLTSPRSCGGCAPPPLPAGNEEEGACIDAGSILGLRTNIRLDSHSSTAMAVTAAAGGGVHVSAAHGGRGSCPPAASASLRRTEMTCCRANKHSFPPLSSSGCFRGKRSLSQTCKHTRGAERASTLAEFTQM